MTEAAPVLEVRDLRVQRGRREVLRVPHLALDPGERLAVIGPNGAGKSTLLEVLALLRPPTQGTVYFRGQPVGGAAAELVRLRRQLAVVFQRPLLLQGTLRENVALGLRLRGQPAGIATAVAQEWLTRLGIAHLAQQAAPRVSVGEAQRASLARALATGPQVLLLDEPFTALDSLARHALLDLLDTVLRAQQCAVVLVTHDWREVRRLASRVGVLWAGELVQLGPVAAVEAHPATADVAAVIRAGQ